MVNTRRKNTEAGANTSKTFFSKEQNELVIQQVHGYSLHETGKYSLNKFVLGLNESSTEADMKKPIITWLLDFTLTKILG